VLGPVALPAQQTRVAGRVIQIQGSDTVPLPGSRVVLHRIGRDVQGPIDSMLTGPRGNFGFRFRADTSAIFLISAGFAGIEYFSPPIHTDAALPDTALDVLVSDTSSSTPVTIASRHMVVGQPGSDGRRPVLEIVVLENPGPFTRIPRDSTTPSWRGPLPAGAVAFEPGNGDFSPDALEFRAGQTQLFAPIAPGEKQVVYSYVLPAERRRVALPIADSIADLDVLLQEPSARVVGPLAAADTERIQGRLFHRWTGAASADSRIELSFPGSPGSWLLPGLVAVTAAGFLVLFVLSRRRRGAVRVSGTGGSDLVERLARLDAQYAGREAEVGPAEWKVYQDERRRLKQELAARLAGRGPPS
jgi:hypothetical protein